MRFILVCTDAGIARLAHIADEIWHEYWPDLIGLAQTDYMVDKFQSSQALTQAIHSDGYQYYLLMDEENIVGYMGVHPEVPAGRLFLSKLYLYKTERGKGYASEAIRFLELLCRENGLASIYLTVNKGNDLAIRAYIGKGFETIEAVETDIGGGFIMDDFIMEKQL